MRKSLPVAYEFGKQFPLQMKSLKNLPASKAIVPRADPALRKPCRHVTFPLDDDTKQCIHRVLEFLQRGNNCPSVVDMISAPMLGESLRIVGLQLGLRVSHLRGFEPASDVG